MLGLQGMLSKLQKELKRAKLDGFITPSTDEFLNEFTPDHLNRLKTLTGFSGSFGIAICNYFITDGRYLLQAKNEIDKSFEIIETRTPKIDKLKGKKIGYDPMTISQRYLRMIECIFGKELNLVPTKNLIDKISKPKPPEARAVFELPLKYAGMTAAEKIRLVREHFKSDFLLVTNPDAICWLLNIRGYDIPYNPYLLAHLLLPKAGYPMLFTDTKKVLHISHVKVLELSELKNHLKGTIQFDPNKTPVWFRQNIKGKVEAVDPIDLIKAVKNKTEIKGFIDCHIEDGKALTAFLKYLEKNWKWLDEISASQKLLEFRKKGKLFQYPSFESISAWGSNGAIIHYRVTPATNKKFQKDNLYLIDSGGQYMNGTTDVTRTVCFGKPSKEHIRNYTLVLKGHITLAMAKFPEGTTGEQLDALARQYLWQAGLDYNHGTGHGVGHFLGVHEGPHSISKLPTRVSLEENMIVSNEPGYYKSGKYGIRIENLLSVVKSKTKGFLEFQTLTQVPYDHKLIDKKLLSKEELKWLSIHG